MTKGQKALEKIGSIVLDKTQDEDYGEITFRIRHLYSKSYEIIKKDLEVLEIIKKGFSKNFLVERLKDAYLRDDLNDEDYEKIENWEWLKDERIHKN